MFTKPDDLDDATIVAALSTRWSFATIELVYQPVGFGSHHWRAGPWFVTVDDLDQKLRTAYDTRDAAYARLDAAFGAQMDSTFMGDLKYSKQIILEEFQRRSAWSKMLEAGATLLSRLL